MSDQKPKVSRPWRLMIVREWHYYPEPGWYELPKPKCINTFTTKERAEECLKWPWYKQRGGYVEERP